MKEESFKMEIASYPGLIELRAFICSELTFVNNPNQNNPVKGLRPGLEPDLGFSRVLPLRTLRFCIRHTCSRTQCLIFFLDC